MTYDDLKEFAFVTASGDVFFEFVSGMQEVQEFLRMHDAVKAMPADHYVEQQRTKPLTS